MYRNVFVLELWGSSSVLNLDIFFCIKIGGIRCIAKLKHVENHQKNILELRNLTVSCLFIVEVISFVHDNYLIQAHQRNYLTKNHNTSPYI